MKYTVKIELDIETNMDADTVERRIEAFLDAASIEEALLDDEKIELIETDIEVKETE